MDLSTSIHDTVSVVHLAKLATYPFQHKTIFIPQHSGI